MVLPANCEALKINEIFCYGGFLVSREGGGGLEGLDNVISSHA